MDCFILFILKKVSHCVAHTGHKLCIPGWPWNHNPQVSQPKIIRTKANFWVNTLFPTPGTLRKISEKIGIWVWGNQTRGRREIREKKTKLVPAGSSWLPQRFKSHLCLSLVNFVSPYTFIHICAFNCKRLNCGSRQLPESILPGRKTPKDHPGGERRNMVIKTTKFRYQR